MESLQDLRARVQKYAVAILAKRMDKLNARLFVLFPVLRAKLLLRKLRKIETL